MSPREILPDLYSCDECRRVVQEPVSSSWFEVSRPSPLVRADDWWQGTRYFCSTACLQTRLDKEAQ